jgi:hypothetical protein
MKPTPLQAGLFAVGAGYAAVLAMATLLVYERHMQYLRHPEDVAASGGMYAFGDWILEIFIVGMLLILTLVLALVIRKRESLYTGYSKFLFGLSLTAPLCLGVFSIPAVNQRDMLLGQICVERMFASPILAVFFVVNRLLARFEGAKRLATYALLIEWGTLALMVGLLLFSSAHFSASVY